MHMDKEICLEVRYMAILVAISEHKMPGVLLGVLLGVQRIPGVLLRVLPLTISAQFHSKK